MHGHSQLPRTAVSLAYTFFDSACIVGFVLRLGLRMLDLVVLQGNAVVLQRELCRLACTT